MMHLGSAWKVLGIKPCDDERAVKRAYAAKLKTIDPDNDIAGFTRLREALEVCRSDARYRKQSAEQPERSKTYDDDGVEAGEYPDDQFFSISADAFGSANIHLRETGPADGEGGLAEDPELSTAFSKPHEIDPRDEQLQQNYQNLIDALQKTPFISKHDRQACDAVNAILADDRIDEIEFSERIEGWLSDVLGSFVPKSDSAILIADAFFGWREEPERANPRWHVIDVGQRALDLACITALKEPDHRWYDAYAAIKQGFPKAFSMAERARLQPQVVELVSSLRQFNPGVEEQLRPEVVDAWMELGHVGLAPELVKSEGISWYVFLVLTFLIYLGIQSLVSLTGS